MKDPDADEEGPVGPSPTEIRDPRLRYEAHRALVWVGVIGLTILAIYLSQTLLVVFGALVFATLIDGGARLLGRVFNIARNWRVAIVLLLTAAFLLWLGYFAGTQIAQEAANLPAIVNWQLQRLQDFAASKGLSVGANEIRGGISQLVSGMGTVTRALGGLIGGLTTVLMIAIIGIYIAIEPRLYERGVAWMMPEGDRDGFHRTISQMGHTLRRLLGGRLLGMVAEGIFTWALLAIYGVPMSALLGLLTGLLAFIPNIGALISGALMVLIGFSGGTDMGIYTIIVYFAVQTFDGYILVPMVAKKTVDLAPALVLAAQLIMGVLFGILGLALADPLVAMIKVALERRAAGDSSAGSTAG